MTAEDERVAPQPSVPLKQGSTLSKVPCCARRELGRDRAPHSMAAGLVTLMPDGADLPRLWHLEERHILFGERLASVGPATRVLRSEERPPAVSGHGPGCRHAIEHTVLDDVAGGADERVSVWTLESLIRWVDREVETAMLRNLLRDGGLT